MSEYLNYFPKQTLTPYQNKRLNEQHVADLIQLPDPSQSLAENLTLAKNKGVKYVIVGVPEDIGPRANCGNGGADKAWENLLPVLLNQQANDFFDWRQCLLLGTVDLKDLQKQSYQASCSTNTLDTLRNLCAQVDVRVKSVLTPIFAADFEIIVIGGGHNNAYPIIDAFYQAKNQQIACANLDPHADFRAVEGRHSGNPFRYAYEEGYLSHYSVVGLHEQKNNKATVDGLKQASFPFYSYQDLFMSNAKTFEQTLSEVKEYVAQNREAVGVELDLDSIKKAAASAYSVAGFTLEQAVRFVYSTATLSQTKYVHLCEGAPAHHEHSEYKSHDVGQILTQLIYSYLKARTDSKE